MEIGPIFRSLIHHKSRFWLIVLEIGLTLAVVANCVHMIKDQRTTLLRPTGMDEEHILIASSEPFTPEFQDEDYVRASYEDDLRALRAIPGVRAATATSSIPLSGSGSATGRRAAGGDVDTITAPYFTMGSDALQALGVELVEGRDFIESDFEEREWGDDEPTAEDPTRVNVIVTQDIADVMFPDGGAVGSDIENKRGTSQNTIVGIIRRMHGSWPTSSVAERVILYPRHPANDRRTRYLVRAEPGMVDSLYTSLETELTRLNDGRIVRVQSLLEYKADTYSNLTALNKMLGGLSVLLVIVTSLGIIGLTSFSVTHRAHEIGTRRALGATRSAIVRYFLVENWLITTVGLTLGLALTYGLNFTLGHFAEVPRIGWPVVASAMLALWVVGLLAALVPAARGATVPPVIATQGA